jgi:hypothetical protein
MLTALVTAARHLETCCLFATQTDTYNERPGVMERPTPKPRNVQYARFSA